MRWRGSRLKLEARDVEKFLLVSRACRDAAAGVLARLGRGRSPGSVWRSINEYDRDWVMGEVGLDAYGKKRPGWLEVESRIATYLYGYERGKSLLRARGLLPKDVLP